MERRQQVECEYYDKRATRLGLVADKTGAGKTLSVIGVILRDKMAWNMDTLFVSKHTWTEAGGLVESTKLDRRPKLPCTLVLVSSSIVAQWKHELAHTNLAFQIILTNKGIERLEPAKCDVVVVVTTMYNNLVASYSTYAWKRFVYDEPGHIRVAGMKTVHAGFYWLVTATPDLIASKHRYCNGFMHKIITTTSQPYYSFDEYLRPMTVKNEPDFIHQSYTLPVTEHLYYDCYHPIMNLVNGLVSPHISSMIEADDIEGAIQALGGIRTKNITELVKQRKLEELETIRAKINIYSMRDDAKNLDIWKAKESRTLQQLSNLNVKFADMLSGQCNICMDTVSNPVLEPQCQNIFCGKCLLKWFKRSQTCPLCRSHINADELIYISTGSSPDTAPRAPAPKPMTKYERILELFILHPDGKFLIFSAYDATFKPICKLLKENDITYALVKGCETTRRRNINDYKSGNTKVIFLNSNYNGAGINLQETTDLILYHDMSYSTQQQIIGRAERIGRTTSLRVHHLMSQIE